MIGIRYLVYDERRRKYRISKRVYQYHIADDYQCRNDAYQVLGGIAAFCEVVLLSPIHNASIGPQRHSATRFPSTVMHLSTDFTSNNG